jgi:hypothetical protein
MLMMMMMMMMLFMLMGWDYISELWLPDDIWAWRTIVELHWQRETEGLRKKPVPVPLCPPQIPHRLIKVCIWASTVRGRWLTAWTTTQSSSHILILHIILRFQTMYHKCTFSLSLTYFKMPWLTQFINNLSLWRPMFMPGLVHVRFVVDEGHWDRFFSNIFGLPLSIQLHCGSPYLYGMDNNPIHGHSS